MTPGRRVTVLVAAMGLLLVVGYLLLPFSSTRLELNTYWKADCSSSVGELLDGDNSGGSGWDIHTDGCYATAEKKAYTALVVAGLVLVAGGVAFVLFGERRAQAEHLESVSSGANAPGAELPRE